MLSPLSAPLQKSKEKGVALLSLSCKARAQTRSLWEKGKKRRRERSKPPPFVNPIGKRRDLLHTKEKRKEGKKERERTASLFLPFGAVKNHFPEKKGM